MPEESPPTQGHSTGFVLRPFFQWLALNDALVASATILVYDYILMLRHETRFVWPQSNRKLGKWLYLATRYLGLFSNILSLVGECKSTPSLILPVISLRRLGNFDDGLSAHTCTVIQLSANGMLLTGIGVAQVILYIRTYVMCGPSPHIKYLLISMFLVLFVSGITGYVFSSRLTYVSVTLDIVPVCFGGGQTTQIAVGYGLVCLSELVVVVLTTYKCVKDAGFENPNTILFVLYRDGILFFLCLFAVSLFNTVASSSLLGAPTLQLQSVFHTVLTSRVILHLHIAAAGGDDGYLEGLISAPIFASAPVPSRGGGSDGLGLSSG